MAPPRALFPVRRRAGSGGPLNAVIFRPARTGRDVRRTAELLGPGRAGALADGVRLDVLELMHAADDPLAALLEARGLQAFLDCSAFAEGVEGRPAAFGWSRLVGLYLELAAGLGPRAWLMVPHVPRKHRASLDLLRGLARELGATRGLQAQLLLPIRAGGELDPVGFYRQAVEALGWRPAALLPCGTGARNLVADFVLAGPRRVALTLLRIRESSPYDLLAVIPDPTAARLT